MFLREKLSTLACAVLIALSACGGDETEIIGNRATDTFRDGETRTVDLPAEQIQTSQRSALGMMRKGEATYYRATGKGNCSFDAGEDRMVAAINAGDYANASLCGAYMSVTGPSGTAIVRIVDRCPGCREGGLDLSREAFNRIAAKGRGRVAVTWQIVAGPVSGPVAYRYMDGSTRYWTAIQVLNHRWPIASLDIRTEGATQWIRVERRAYNYFVQPKRIAAGRLRVRITALTGETLEDELPEPKGSLLLQGQSQFR